ncbi:hypothetical protein ACFVH6_25845 [Spirillospora sp. NPDC127200]
MSEFDPNPSQALLLKVLAEDGSPNFGEKLHTYTYLHDAAIETGERCCPCFTCDPEGELRLTF